MSNDGGHVVETRNRPPPVLGNREFVTSLYFYGRHIRYVEVTWTRNPACYAELSGEYEAIFRIPQIQGTYAFITCQTIVFLVSTFVPSGAGAGGGAELLQLFGWGGLVMHLSPRNSRNRDLLRSDTC